MKNKLIYSFIFAFFVAFTLAGVTQSVQAQSKKKKGKKGKVAANENSERDGAQAQQLFFEGIVQSLKCLFTFQT